MASIVLSDKELEEMLEEWAYWATFDDEPITETCCSAEGNYRSPQIWQPANPRPREPHPDIGPRVEAAWRTLDARAKGILRAWYVVSRWALGEDERRMHEKRMQLTAARCRHSADTVEMLLGMARQEIAVRLMGEWDERID